MRRKSSLIFAFLIAHYYFVKAQSSDFEFIQHLEQLGEYKEGLLFINQLDSNRSGDSIAFYKGRLLYQLKDLEGSIRAFESIPSSNGSLGSYARFYEGLQLAYLKQYDESFDRFQTMNGLESISSELRKFELSGVSLLKRDIKSFDSIVFTYDYQYFQLSENQQALKSIRNDWVTHPKKSPILAGVLSAIVPGSGKCYQGKIGEGIMSLATTGIFALQALEGYRKDGANSPRFYIFSSVFALFYTANIYGTVVSVRMEKEKFNKQIDETILVNMHIPIRIFFK